MCFAIPGKIVGIKGDKVSVDYGGEKRQAAFQDIELAKGDYVIVQGSFVIQKLDREEAEEVIKIWQSSLQ